jgi:hypothetical protein
LHPEQEKHRQQWKLQYKYCLRKYFSFHNPPVPAIRLEQEVKPAEYIPEEQVLHNVPPVPHQKAVLFQQKPEENPSAVVWEALEGLMTTVSS